MYKVKKRTLVYNILTENTNRGKGIRIIVNTTAKQFIF